MTDRVYLKLLLVFGTLLTCLCLIDARIRMHPMVVQKGEVWMVYLLVSVVSAMAIAITTFAETSSFLLAFAAYSITGTLVLSTILLSSFLDLRAEDKAED